VSGRYTGGYDQRVQQFVFPEKCELGDGKTTTAALLLLKQSESQSVPQASQKPSSEQRAHEWLNTFDDEVSASITTETSAEGRKINVVSTPSSLREGETLQVLSWCLTLIDKYQPARVGANGLEHLDTGRVWKSVTLGVNPPLTVDQSKIPRSVRKSNYLKEDNSLEAQWMDRQDASLVKAGAVRPETFPGEAQQLSRVFLAEKGIDGFRLILDLREVNDYFVKIRFSLISLKAMRNDLVDVVYMTVDDLRSSYGHLGIHPDIQKFFAYRWRGKIRILTEAPYGGSPIPELFQQIASVARRINDLIGLSPELQTAEDWTAVATGRRKLPPAGNRFKINIRQFLDDFAKFIHSFLRSCSGELYTGKRLDEVAPKLMVSFSALMEALGYKLSETKCQRDPYGQHEYLGLTIFTKKGGGDFGIPPRKVIKNVERFQLMLRMKKWTLRNLSEIASRVLQFSLVWKKHSSRMARPFYFALADAATHGSTWSDEFTPTPLLHEMLHEIVGYLEGPNKILRASMVDREEQYMILWSAEHYDAFKDSNGKDPLVFFGDAGAVMLGGFLTECPLDELTQREQQLTHKVEAEIVANKNKLSFWKRLVVDKHEKVLAGSELMFWKLIDRSDRNESSTYREQLLCVEMYEDKEVVAKIISRLKESGRTSWVHVTDSKAMRDIIKKGSSKSRRCNNLNRRLFKALRVFEDQGFTVLFVWLPRDAVGPSVADSISKTKNWLIVPKAFEVLQREFKFDLDAFASVSERVLNERGEPLNFCSRAMHTLSLGDGRHTSWEHHSVWAFPPPQVEKLIELALTKCVQHSGLAVLCLATWQYKKHETRYRSKPWTRRMTLAKGSARMLTNELSDTNDLVYRHSNFGLVLLVFDNRS